MTPVQQAPVCPGDLGDLQSPEPLKPVVSDSPGLGLHTGYGTTMFPTNHHHKDMSGWLHLGVVTAL